MFSLYSTENTAGNNNFCFIAGSSAAVSRTVSKLEKRCLHMKQHITISSDINAISNFKHKLKQQNNLIIRMNFIEMVGGTNCPNDVIKVILDLFFQCHLHKVQKIQICKKCGLMGDNEKVFGKVLLGIDKVKDCFKSIENWICNNCKAPFEFALISWRLDDSISSDSNYIILASQRTVIQRKLSEMKRVHSDARVVLNIGPSFRAKEISHYIKSKFISQKPYQILNSNECFYQEVIVESFLSYFIQKYENNKKAIKLCKSCCRAFLGKGEKELGQIFVTNKDSVSALASSPEWICAKCESSLFILYALKAVDGSLDYFICTNQKDRYILNKIEKDYLGAYPCFKFWCPFIRSTYMKCLIGQMKTVTIKGNRIETKMDKYELMRTIYKIHCWESLKRAPITTICCALCKRRADADLNSSKNFGSIWCDKIEEFPHYGLFVQCQWHQINNILFWNMYKCNSTSLLEDYEVVFKNCDITCLMGSEENIEGIFPQFFQNHRVFCEIGANKYEARLMILVKKDILASYEKLSYSNRGLFIKIDLTVDCIILGIINWPESDGDSSEGIDDWIRELETIITTHNAPDVKFIVGGTFNCRVGNLNNGFKDEAVFWNGKLNVKRDSSDVVVDKRGAQLAELMKKNNFILCNGRTASDYPGKFTYYTACDCVITDLVWVNTNCGYKVKDMKIHKLQSNNFKQHSAQILELSPPD